MTEILNSHKVTLMVWYYPRLKEGMEDLIIRSGLIGVDDQRTPFSPIMREYVHQERDTPDLPDELREDPVGINQIAGSILMVHDRTRKSIVVDSAAMAAVKASSITGRNHSADIMVPLPQILIPTIEESKNPGMSRVTDAFNKLVPFPKVRSFLQYWQREIGVPINHIEFASAPVHRGGIGAAAAIKTLN